ncbi:MAG: phage major capsid protein [Phocaeicola sp.]
MDYDFCGWATRNDLKCSDGRIIRRDAFKHNDGETVPLVWNHDHADPYRVIGHALLENRDEGVYAYGSFNDTELGQTAKVYVEHGDITAMSIYANQLQQQGPNVMHGSIREVSLVLAGANPGAYIENVIKHGDETDDEARIYTGMSIELYHAENGIKKENEEQKGDNTVAEETKKTESSEKEETVADVFNTFTDKQKNVVYALIGQALEDAGVGENADTKETNMKHADAEKETGDETIADVFNTFTDKQKNVVYALIGQALEDAGVGDEEDDEDDDMENKGGNENMKHNVFDQEEKMGETLSHSEMTAIIDDAKRCGSLKEAVLAHGIESIDIMFPDAKTMSNVPEVIKRDDMWVNDVLGGVHHTPFTRIKSIVADITAEEARAKGYVKGNLKLEEVIKLLKRITNPTTIYKKQKLDRDDVLDIKDFDIIAWLKSELRMMLNEELARAVLVGDGRTSLSEDKINEENIRPIWTDADLYTVKVEVSVANTATDSEKAKAFIRACIKSRKSYKGSGNPIMFMDEDLLTDCLLIEDTNGRVIYDTVEKLAAALRVRKIVSVPVMDNLTREVDGKTHTLAGIYVNLADYNIGTDKGGEVNMFDDFDIDYNQMKYLIETRCSGALTKPYSAVAIEFVPKA